MRIGAFMVVALGFAAAPASAADQSAAAPRSYYPNSYYPPATMWTGFYVGLHVGGAFTSVSWTDPYPPFANMGYTALADRPTGSGILGGAQFGANWQSDWLVYGFEVDASGTSLSASATDAANFINSFRATWLATVTGRLGYAAGEWLFYAKGGAAFVQERESVTAPVPTTFNTNIVSCAGGNVSFNSKGAIPPLVCPAGTTFVGTNVVEPGWTVGAGAEYAFTHNWSARIEYDFIDTNHSASTPIVSPSGSIEWAIHKVVGGVNYRF